MGSRKELSEGEMEDEAGIEEDTTDSLDIKPPQAARAEKKHKKKVAKEKKHGKHKHRKSDERYIDRFEGAGNKYHRRERGGYGDYFQHPSRPGREQQPRYDQNYPQRGGEYYKQRHYQERGDPGYHGRYEQRHEYDQRYPQRPPPAEKPETQPRRRPQTPEEDADKILDDLRTKLLMKKSKHDEMEAASKESKGGKEKKRHRKEEVLEEQMEDEELVARRARLLEADREMARRKEAAREELEARREKRREKEKSESPVPKKKPRELPKTPPQKDEDVVMVSDRSDEEESDSDSDSKSEESEEGSEEDSQHSSEGVLPVSPLSVGDLSKSERRRRSDSKSRKDLRSSRSRSLSGSEHSGSQSGSLSSRSGGSRSPSRSEEEEESPEQLAFPGPGSPQPKKEGPRTPKTPESPKDEEKKDEPEEEELPPYFPAIQGCRSVEEFQCLNRIEEGTYGVVYRAKDKRTEEIVALKRLKMEKEKEGFPITSLREINTLLKGQHPNIVTVREIVVGSNMDKIFIVMDYVEHDLKSLMETMKHKKQFFLPGEVKCLLQQLLRAVAHLHDNWILHRDLKTSNLLLSHKGILKVGDFGLAREYGSPLKAYTPIVVTLWYRAPELLLCCKEYSTPIDVWSVGCIFAEFLSMQPLFPGKSEVDQLNRIFKDLGTPNEKIWPGYNELPAVQKMTFTDYPVSNLRKKFSKFTSELGLALLQGLLTYDPKTRLTAEKALQSTYFKELPLPIDPAMFPTWPAKSEVGLKKALASSPKPPSGGREFKRLGEDANEPAGFHLPVTFAESRQMQMGPGFSLKF